MKTHSVHILHLKFLLTLMQGETALDLAKERGRKDIIALLEEATKRNLLEQLFHSVQIGNVDKVVEVLNSPFGISVNSQTSEVHNCINGIIESFRATLHFI